MRKQKVLTPDEQEEIRTKDFFDMILPSTVKFMSDHYIVGDSYRCVLDKIKRQGGTMPSWWTMVWFMEDHLVNYPL